MTHRHMPLRAATTALATALTVLAVLGADDLARWGSDLPPGPVSDGVVHVTEVWRTMAAPLGGPLLAQIMHQGLEHLRTRP